MRGVQGAHEASRRIWGLSRITVGQDKTRIVGEEKRVWYQSHEWIPGWASGIAPLVASGSAWASVGTGELKADDNLTVDKMDIRLDPFCYRRLCLVGLS